MRFELTEAGRLRRFSRPLHSTALPSIRDHGGELYMSFMFKGREILTDDAGYLLNRADWSEELMYEMAQQMEFKLSAEHLAVINAVREYSVAYAAVPAMRGLIAFLKQQGRTDLANSITLAELFPEGAVKTAARLAGLPKPVSCV